MLAGFAIENLFKGRILQDNPGLIPTSTSGRTGEKRLPKILHSHDLATLAARTPVQLSESEKDLLRHLTAAAVWWGRYPVPRTPEGMQHQRKDGSRAYTQMFSSTVIAETMDLLQKVRDQLFPDVRSFAELNGIDPSWLGLQWAYRGRRGMPVQKR
jgi:hypothetical protein